MLLMMLAIVTVNTDVHTVKPKDLFHTELDLGKSASILWALQFDCIPLWDKAEVWVHSLSQQTPKH